MTKSSPDSLQVAPPENEQVDPRTTMLVRDYDHPDAQRLVDALYRDQVERYGYADPAEADASIYRPPDGLFLVAYVDGVAVACGGFRTYDAPGRTVEIKKMYTVAELRGRGLGGLILNRLEAYARRGGARRAILETGVRNTAALALYCGVGFLPTDRYVNDRDPEINRAFVKDLSDP
jgi:GNAT superfamily N-acetyltransferase